MKKLYDLYYTGNQTRSSFNDGQTGFSVVVFIGCVLDHPPLNWTHPKSLKLNKGLPRMDRELNATELCTGARVILHGSEGRSGTLS